MKIKVSTRISKFLLALSFFTLCANSYSEEPQHWYTTARLTYLSAAYNNAQYIARQDSGRLMLATEYLEKNQIQFAANFSTFSFKDKSPNYTQNTFALFAQHYFYTDLISGRTGVQIGYLKVTGKNLTANNIYNAAFNYLNYSGKFYFHTSYTNSRYGNSQSGFSISQIKPGLGFQLYFPQLWANVSNVYTAHSGDGHYDAMDYSLTFNLINRPRLFPSNLTIGATTGKRQYYVDEQNALVYNTEDLLKEEFYLSAAWNIKDSTYFYLSAGQQNYLDTSNQNYSLNYFAITFTRTW